MTRAALIIFGDDMPQSRVVGLGWPEFQLRQAVQAGARHIVVVAGRVTREIVVAMDRLRAEGLSATLVRTPGEAADLFHPDEAVLLLSGTSVVASTRLDDLFAFSGVGLLCARGVEASDRYELIDAHDRWVGIARLQGAQVRATAEGVGEWDFASMLLRAAVRAKAQRFVLGESDRLIDATDPGGAVRASQAIVGDVPIVSTGWGGRWILNPTVRLVARFAAAALPAIARFGPWLVAALLIVAPWASWSLGGAVGSALLLLAMLTTLLGKVAAGSTGTAVRLARTIPVLTAISASASLAVATWPHGFDWTQPTLASVLVGLCILIARLNPDAAQARWLADVPGHAIVLLVAALFGPLGLTIGLIATVAHAFASLAWLQNRLSPPLTC